MKFMFLVKFQILVYIAWIYNIKVLLQKFSPSENHKV